MRDWTDDEVKILRKMHYEGATATAIHQALPNKTINQVRSLITRHRDEFGLQYRFVGTSQPQEYPPSFNCERCKELLRRKW